MRDQKQVSVGRPTGLWSSSTSVPQAGFAVVVLGCFVHMCRVVTISVSVTRQQSRRIGDGDRGVGLVSSEDEEPGDDMGEELGTQTACMRRRDPCRPPDGFSGGGSDKDPRG